MPRKAANSNNEGDVELRTCCWATKKESTVTVEFLLDGTLANEQVNVERSLRRNRDITIVYVYQDTLLAWEFVKARELTEGRNIPKAEFIRQLFFSEGGCEGAETEISPATQG